MKLPSILLLILLSFALCFGQVRSANRKVTVLDKLGPHQTGGRGCVGCHVPHTSPDFDEASAHEAFWSSDLGPDYARSTTLPEDMAPDVSVTPKLDENLNAGIVICLSCHDGNIALGAMMTNQAYEPTLLGFPSGYGLNAIPTFPGYAPILSSRHVYRDHPIGPSATLGAVGVASRLVLTSCGASGTPCLEPNVRDQAFMTFYENYGAFNITQKDAENRFFSGGHSSGVVIPNGATDANSAYLVCVTCHEPHSLSNFRGNVENSEQSAVYSTYWFVSAPYNPNAPTAGEWAASSATQFCRQCHFTGPGGANESSGIMTIHTRY